MKNIQKFFRYIIDNFKKVYLYIFLSIFFFIFIIFLHKYYSQYFTFSYWGNENNLNRSETLRNIGLIIVGIVAIIIALWRGFIASNELKNSKIKLHNEKLHKAVELLETKSERNKISAFLMLAELIKESCNFDEIIFQILHSYLDEYANIQKEFQEYSDLSMDKLTIHWYEVRERVNYSILFCFEIYIKLVEEKKVKINLNQLRFINLNLHGLHIKMPNYLIQNSDLSNCHIYCNEYTSFSNCDLTNAVVYPYKDKTLIFNHCNISDLRLNVDDNINPIINGWHWEERPPKLNSMWSFLNFPKDRRVIIMSSNRIISKSFMENYYKDPFNLVRPQGGFDIFEDKFEFDDSNQKIISEIEFNESNKISNKTERL